MWAVSGLFLKRHLNQQQWWQRQKRWQQQHNTQTIVHFMCLLFLASEMKVLTCVTFCVTKVLLPQKWTYERRRVPYIGSLNRYICNRLVNVCFFPSMLDAKLEVYKKIIDSINCHSTHFLGSSPNPWIHPGLASPARQLMLLTSLRTLQWCHYRAHNW